MNTEQERADLLPCPFCGSTNIEIQISTPDREGVPTSLMCSDCGASGPWEYEQDNIHAKADAAWNRRAALQSQKPNVEFEDPRVQLVYGIICGGHEPPEGEHWDGYVSRLIVDALQSQDREDAERYRRLRKGDIDDVAVVRGLGAMDYGASAVVATYSEEIDGDDLDTTIDRARRAEGEGE